jgi:hypothetical protein
MREVAPRVRERSEVMLGPVRYMYLLDIVEVKRD